MPTYELFGADRRRFEAHFGFLEAEKERRREQSEQRGERGTEGGEKAENQGRGAESGLKSDKNTASKTENEKSKKPDSHVPNAPENLPQNARATSTPQRPSANSRGRAPGPAALSKSAKSSPSLRAGLRASPSQRTDLRSIARELQATPPERNPDNLWILKPEGLNRGYGVVVVRSLAEVDAHIATCRAPVLPALKGAAQAPKEATSEAEDAKIAKITNVRTSQRFLVQKYIEDPLLFRGRKFDIRCFALATARGECFVYDRGYLRTASARFDPASADMGAHLCNNAVQKLLSHYNEFEEGNMQSFADLDAEIARQVDAGELKVTPTDPAHCFTTEIWPRIKQTVAQALCSAGKDLLNGFECPNCFELFGFDFMITNRLTHLLIECNVNPCLELSSPVSWWLLPEMLDDMFQLTIDKSFVDPNTINYLPVRSKSHKKSSTKPEFPRKTLQQWRDTPADQRQVEGLRWEVQAQGMSLDRPNEWIKVIQDWKELEK